MKQKTKQIIVVITVIALVLIGLVSGCVNPLAEIIERDLSVSDIMISVDDTEIPSTDGSYIFAASSSGSIDDVTFTITNSGTGVLSLNTSPVEITGNDAASFSIISQPEILTLSGGETTSFILGFSATETRTYTASVRVSSNDPDEAEFTFTIQATIGADILVSRGSTEIDLSGGSDNLGTVYYDNPEVFTYTISNMGTATLELTGSPYVAGSGTGSMSSDVSQPSSGSILPGASQSYSLVIDPVNIDDLSLNITIESNDADEGSATFTASFQTLLQSPEVGVARIAGGYLHSVAVKSDGTVWCWGNNDNGQLGDNGVSGADSDIPIQVLKGAGSGDSIFLGDTVGICAIDGGRDHTAALKSDGTVWCWGDNDYGQLGDDNIDTSSNIPVQVSGLTDVVSIACGMDHTVALKKDGTVWSWGRNNQDQLGVGTGIESGIPVQVPGLFDVTAIACGWDFTAVKKGNGTVWCWGNNSRGQLGDGNADTDSDIPVQVLKGSSTGDSTYLGDTVPITAIVSGGYHVVALNRDGVIWSWGRNDAGQLGDGNSGTDSDTPVKVLKGASPGDAVWLGDKITIAAIAAGNLHTAALNENGTIFCWGDNGFSQLGDGNSTTDSDTPVRVLNGSSSSDSTYLGDTVPVTAIECGGSHSAVINNNGLIFSWGYNLTGQLGNGSDVDSDTPVAVLTALTDVAMVASGTHYTSALMSDGTVWCWGDNFYGQLGDGTEIDRTNPVLVSDLTNVTAIASGAAHTMALKSDGTVWCWGMNSSGQLGNDSTDNSSSPVQVSGLAGVTAIAGGEYHSIALKNDGTVWCWGNNSNGRLGIGTIGPYEESPVQVLKGAGSGDTSYLGDIVAVTAIAGGYTHSIALVSDGTMWCWGDNDNGQLGDGTSNIDRTIPVQVEAGACAADTAYLGDTVAVTAIAGGEYYTDALKSDGTMWCWGIGGYLGDGSGAIDVKTPAQVLRGACTDDTTYLGDTVGLTAIACSYGHTIALKNDGTVWCWGYNGYGQLGDGTSGPAALKDTPVQVLKGDSPGDTTYLGDSAVNITGIGGRGNQTIALKSDGTVWCWGQNDQGQLGDGTTTDRSTPVQAMLMFNLK